MTSLATRRAQWFIIGGFLLVAVAAVVAYVNEFFAFQMDLHSLRGLIGPVLSPLTAIAALWAWWWLSQIEARDDHQRSLLRRAFYGLAAQNLFFFGSWLIILLPLRELGQWLTSAVVWADTIGAVMSSLGFLLLARSFVARGDDVEVMAATN